MADGLTVLHRVRAFLEAIGPTTKPMVVAVSGGPDSVALLRSLCSIGPSPLIVAHLNHRLRGQDSDADEAFVEQLVEQLRVDSSKNIDYRSARRDVATGLAGKNMEDSARRIRYKWLAEVAKDSGADRVATGHTADDQAETMLFQLLRGTGLHGLAGIAARRPLDGNVMLIRPLLTVTRSEVLTFLRRLGQDYREDASNADLSRTRNRIRHELLPHLAATYNPRIVDVLCRLAEQAAEELCDQDEAAEELLRFAERPRAGRVLVFDRAALAQAARHRLRGMWRHVWEREGWPRGAMGFRKWDRLAALCSGEPAALDLPGGIRARQCGPVIQVGPTEGGCDA
jgi:tRNA(Ile)-lysidine synthase